MNLIYTTFKPISTTLIETMLFFIIVDPNYNCANHTIFVWRNWIGRYSYIQNIIGI